jgi:arginyl-tRNA synthetase
LISSLKLVFDAAIVAAFPEAEALGLNKSVIARCANAKNGDFQCNNAMSLAKAIKTEKDTMGHYAGKSIVHYAREKEKSTHADVHSPPRCFAGK